MHGILTFLAAPVSLLYKTGAWLQRTWRARRPRGPAGMFIISVDGIAFGGSGKTPMVIRVGKELRHLGVPFAVVTRGYGSRLEGPGTRVDPELHGPADVGEEALLISRNLGDAPVWIGRDRIASLYTAARAGFKVAILDDGFQSTHIHRQLKIMLFNPDQPWTLLRHFPILMREADLMLTYAPARRRGPGFAHGSFTFSHEGFFDIHGRRHEVQSEPLFAFSGLGDNERFRRDMSRFHLTGFRAFPDHHAYTRGEMSHLERLRKKTGARFLVCTEKDIIKAASVASPELPLIYAGNGVQLDIDLGQYLRRHVPGQNETHT